MTKILKTLWDEDRINKKWEVKIIKTRSLLQMILNIKKWTNLKTTHLEQKNESRLAWN